MGDTVAKPETSPAAARVSLTVDLPHGGRIGPEDVDLIETIARERSIVGAGRALGQSYRKTWLMVDALNRMFESRVIDTFPGRRQAGATVTDFGRRLVALYRSAERRANATTARALDEIVASLDWRFEAAVTPADAVTPTARDAAAADRPY